MTKAKERPIIFNAQEVNAVLAGDKTQHRLPVLNSEQVAAGYEWDFSADGDAAIFYKYAGDGISIEKTLLIGCPFGAIGDRLWVQELHARTENEDLLTRTHYYADGPLTLDLRHDAGLLIKYAAKSMPRWASRLLLEITDIRIERVQDISEDDALELGGFEALSIDGGHTWKYGLLENSVPFDDKEDNESYYWSKWSLDYKDAVMCLWDNIHGKGAWDRNDWVWVVEFKIIEGANNAD